MQSGMLTVPISLPSDWFIWCLDQSEVSVPDCLFLNLDIYSTPFAFKYVEKLEH